MSRPSARSAARDAARRLTAGHAGWRGTRVANPDYVLSIGLDSAAADFDGHVRIRFDFAGADEALTLDFSGGRVTALKINGDTWPVDYNGAFPSLPADALAQGENVVDVHYTQGYGEGGVGLHRLTDSTDGRVYVYSHFEPYDANRLFPCFDQPDIKGRFELTVTAPADWVVVSAMREQSVTAQGEKRRWQFPRSARFSTYLFSLHAGPFDVREDAAGDIPLRLFTRRSMTKHVDARHWFWLTRLGFAYFQDYFGLDYPYGKYDSVVVPDFNIGAMENVAAVTFSEAYVSRGAPTRRDARRLADVVLHEMSHMWFGNLVTMPWWDGLWLKESFATFMAQQAAAEAAGLDDMWHAFSVESKARARRADLACTTHPVDVPVPDTREAFAQFDAITYNKGASALAQLAHYVGPAAFKAGVRAYLAAHAGGVATLADFVRALAEATGEPLDGWIDEWILSAGMNTLRVRMDIDDDRIAGFAVEQTATPALPTLRRHRVQVGLYRRGPDGNVQTLAVEPVTVRGAHTPVPALVGLPAPDLVCPNAGDWGFVAFDPDPATLKNLPAMLGDLPEPPLRSAFIQALWDRTRAAAMPLAAFLEVTVDQLSRDSDELVCRQMFACIDEALRIMGGADPVAPLRTQAAMTLETMTWSRMLASDGEGDGARFWLDSHLRVAFSEKALSRLARHLAKEPGSQVPLDADRRWAAIVALAAAGYPGSADLVAAERRRDPSDRADKMALAADAAWPDAAVKERWLTRLLDTQDTLSLSRQRHVMAHLFPTSQARLHRQFAARILAPLAALGAGRDEAFLRAWAGMLPVLSDTATRRLLEGAVVSADDLHPVLLRALHEGVEEAGRRNAMVHAT